METASADDKWSRMLGWLVVATCLFTVIAVALLHVLQADFNPYSQAISEYVHGPYGFLMTATFFSQSLGSFALAGIAVRNGQRQRKAKIGAALFIISALGAAVAGVFPADLASPYPQTPAGVVHATAGLARFLALAVALPLLSSTLAANFRWRKTAKVLRSIGILFVAVFLISIFVLANIDLFGLGQRTFISILLIWMFIAASPLIRPGGE